MLFGSNRDFELLVKVNRELLKDIVEQEVLFYKLNLEETEGFYIDVIEQGFRMSLIE